MATSGKIERLRQRDQILVGLELFLEPVVLDFDEEAFPPEDLGQFDRVVARGVRPLVEEVVGDRAAEAGGRGDDACPCAVASMSISMRGR